MTDKHLFIGWRLWIRPDVFIIKVFGKYKKGAQVTFISLRMIKICMGKPNNAACEMNNARIKKERSNSKGIYVH